MAQPTLFDLDPAPPTTVPSVPSELRQAPTSVEVPPDPRGRDVLLAVDGNSVVHRAFHAYERSAMTSPSDGRPLWAVYGFLALFAGIADRVSPTHVVVGFDSVTSVRKERWPFYKAQRSSAPDSLYSQMDEIRVLLGELGVSVVEVSGWEADDVIGSASAAAESAGLAVVVATSDRDAFNLISDATTVMRLGSGLDNAQMMTPQRLIDDYGVRPDQYLSFAALRGDPSDNLPGVSGFGPKTAQKLLATCSVREALADPDLAVSVVGKAAAARLAAGADAFDLNRAVMEIRRDLVVDVAAARLDVDGSTVGEVCHRHEVRGVSERLVAALGSPSHTPAGDSAFDEPF